MYKKAGYSCPTAHLYNKKNDRTRPRLDEYKMV